MTVSFTINNVCMTGKVLDRNGPYLKVLCQDGSMQFIHSAMTKET